MGKGIYVYQQIVKTTAEWASDENIYPANVFLLEKLQSGKFNIAISDGTHTYSELTPQFVDCIVAEHESNSATSYKLVFTTPTGTYITPNLKVLASVAENTASSYKLSIRIGDTVIDTPNLKGDGASYVPTLLSAPDEDTLSYTKDGVTTAFVIGQQCRVPSQDTESGYTFYVLADLNTSTNKAAWQEVGGSITLDTMPARGSENPVTSGGVYNAIKYGFETGPASLTLEKTSNPEFTVINKGTGMRYADNMGGYMFFIKDGTVYAAKLDTSAWDKFADGTQVTTAIENACETMVHVPDCYVRGSNKTLQFGGETQYSGMHKIGSPNWVGAYLMSVDGNGKGHSRPNTTPAHSKTMSAFWDCAQLLGQDFGLANYQFHQLINALFQVCFGNLDSQTIIGPGFQHSNWTACRDVNMGLTRSIGDGSGKVYYNDATIGDQFPVKLFGFEDLWGKLWEFRPGIRFYMEGSVRKAVIYEGNVVSNTASGRVISDLLQSASGTYANQMELGEYWDMIAHAAGGSETTYYCDGYWAATAGELLSVGGNANVLAQCGLSCAHSAYAFSGSFTHFGARLAFYGNPTIVSGAELAELMA